MASVTWTDPALNDLRETCEFISRDSPRVAEIFANRAFGATDRLSMFPSLGRVVPEIEREEVREIILGNYRIVYSVLPDEVEVTAVVHGARQVSSEILKRQ